MKNSIPLFTAAAAALAALIRQVMEAPFFFPDDQAAEIPRMTPKLVQQYVLMGGRDQDIADRFLVDIDEFRRQFAPVLRSTRGYRKIHLLSMQFESAKKLCPTMLIFLGKNELGQSNNPTQPGEPEPEIAMQDP